MRRHRRRPTLAAVIALSTGISAADAQGLAVFDPLNYQQNLLTAVRALESLQNQVRLLQGQAQQLLRMDLNLQPLRGGIGGDLQSTLAQLRARIGEGDALALKVRETDAALERLYPGRFSEALSNDELVRAARSRWEEAHASFRRAAALQAQVGETIDGDGQLLGRRPAAFAVGRRRTAGGPGRQRARRAQRQAGATTPGAPGRPASRRECGPIARRHC